MNSPTESKRNKEQIVCNSCGQSTWHLFLFKESVHHQLNTSEDEAPIYVSEKWEVFQCMGCDEITIRKETEYPWDENEYFEFFPERTSAHHRQKNYQKLPDNLQGLYSEVVNAFNRNTLVLCAAGVRALLEGLCENKGITEGNNEQGKVTKNLEGKINGLTSIVPAGIVKNLHGLRFLGNQALHNLETPSKDDLELALTVIEDIFNIVYDLNYKSQLLYEKVTRPKPVVPKALEEDDIF